MILRLESGEFVVVTVMKCNFFIKCDTKCFVVTSKSRVNLSLAF